MSTRSSTNRTRLPPSRSSSLPTLSGNDAVRLQRRIDGELQRCLWCSAVSRHGAPDLPRFGEHLRDPLRVRSNRRGLRPLNARMPPAELRVFVQQSKPRLLVAEELSPRRRRKRSGPTTSSWPTRTSSSPTSAMWWRRVPSCTGAAPVLIAYTSGTSGAPRGAVLTHEALTLNALNSFAAVEMTADDEIVTPHRCSMSTAWTSTRPRHSAPAPRSPSTGSSTRFSRSRRSAACARPSL